MQNVLSFYNTRVPQVSVNYNDWCVDNPFLKILRNTFYEPCLAANKIPQFVFDDAANKVGIVAPAPKFSDMYGTSIKRQDLYNPARNTSVVNLFGYKGYFNNSISFMQEVAEAQWYLEGHNTPYKPDATLNKMLFTDYLLRASICYVEVFRGGTVTKFYATRNVELLAQLSVNTKSTTDAVGNVVGGNVPYLPVDKTLAVSSVRKGYETYLALGSDNMQAHKLSYLKLNPPSKKSGTYSIVMPRGALANLETSMQYRITPVFGLRMLSRHLELLAQKSILKLTYVKDNLQLREFYTTTNFALLRKYMDDNADGARDILQACSTVGDRGYLRLPDITLLSTGNCIRAVDMRITQIAVLDPQNFVNAYAGINLQRVPDVMREYLQASQNDRTQLERIYVNKELLDKYAQRKQLLDAYAYYVARSTAATTSEEAQQYGLMAKHVATDYDNICSTTATAVHNNTVCRTPDVICAELNAWLDYGVSTFSTTFLRRLHDMMLSDEKTFPGYAERIKQAGNKQTVVRTPVSVGFPSLGDA